MQFTATRQHETETAKKLRRSPAMHGRVVPAKVQLTAAERTFPGLPIAQDLLDRYTQISIHRWKTTAKQHSEVDTFGIVVQLTPVDCQPGSPGERLRDSLVIEQILRVVSCPAFDRAGTVTISG